MGFTYLQSGSWNRRLYSSVNIATGNPIIDDGTGKPLREKDGSLAARSLGRAQEGQPKFRRLVSRAGKPIRIQQSIKLVDKDDNSHKSATSLAVLMLAQRLEDQIKEWEAEADKADGSEELRPDASMTVSAFFDNVFMPYVDKNKEAATAKSYRAYWDAYLASHFNHSKTLRGYEAFTGTNLLEKLASEYSDNTVNHVRALASTIFTYACSKGYIKYNPWHDIKKTAAGQDVEEGYAYNQKEVENILGALSRIEGRARNSAEVAAMVVTIGFYAGLRPSETAGLRWENVSLNDNTIVIKEAYVNGNHKGTKNSKTRTIVMLPALSSCMRLWANRGTTGWVFPNRSGDKPIVMNDLSARIIAPAMERAGLPKWQGFYSLRRGFGTMMVLAGATLQEVADAMGNTSEVVEKHYFRAKKSQLAASGMAKLAAAMAGQTGRTGTPSRMSRKEPDLLAGETE